MSGVAQTVDPLGGSYFLERLTLDMEKGGFDYFEKLDAMGGMVAAIEKGYPQKEIAEASYQFQRATEAFSRAEYVLGKMWILIVLMSLMTWVPGLLLFLLQAYLEDGWAWMQANSSLAVGLFFGSWVWLLILALMALALSAWVKWKPAAGALMFGVFFVAAGFGVAINGVQRTRWGHLFN